MTSASFKFKEQDLLILEQLHVLEGRKCLPDNFVLFDCGSFSEEANHQAMVCFKTLTKNFHIIIIDCDALFLGHAVLDENYTVLKNIPSRMLRNVKNPSEHIATLLVKHITVNTQKSRRAYYCLSGDKNFPLNNEMISVSGREFVYCCVLKSVKDFRGLLYLGYFSEDFEDPANMRLHRIIEYSIPRDTSNPNKGGKLMYFNYGDHNIAGVSVQLLWRGLRQFGDINHYHVSVTTAFPSVDYLVRKFISDHKNIVFYM